MLRLVKVEESLRGPRGQVVVELHGLSVAT